LPLPSAAADLASPRPGAFTAFRCALTRPSALLSVPFVLADTAAGPRVLTTPAAFLRTGALLAPAPVDGLASGSCALASVVRGLRATRAPAVAPARFVTAFEARVSVTCFRAGALRVLALADDLGAAFRAPADVARALPAPLFLAADPTRFAARASSVFFRAGALLVVGRTAWVRRPGLDVTLALTLPAALLAPVFVRVGLPAEVLEDFAEGTRLTGLRDSSSVGVLAIWLPHRMEAAVASSAVVGHSAQWGVTRQSNAGARHRALALLARSGHLSFSWLPLGCGQRVRRQERMDGQP
jgi:hypothetical protein